ncbi:ATP-binding protein [Arcticibacter sp. MXS-1]|uniref:PAS domain-containing sensor histidine kinase n=1 Tax=Arcticibacter sp. MXS-1 TaxID=3341726 RepID=UPI0035A89A76
MRIWDVYNIRPSTTVTWKQADHQRSAIYHDMAEEITFSVDTNSSNLSFAFGLSSRKFIYYKHDLTALLDVDGKDLAIDKVLAKVHPDDLEHLETLKGQLQAGGGVRAFDFRIQTNGKEKWLRLNAFLAKTDTEKAILGQIEDISGEIENVHTLRKFANKKNSVLNIIAHDLRGPLGTANMMTQVLSKEAQDSNLSRYIEPVSRILKQSIDLISDLTEREFFETAEVALVKKRMDVVTKLREWMEEYSASEWISQRTFRFSSSHRQLFVEIDESKFIQIFNNLMTNALKFTREGDSISLELINQKDSVLFSFKDSGVGIPQEHHDMIFEKFTDAKRKGLHGEPTVGLGLSIVKTIISWHGGNIWLESKENSGTTFYIQIPKRSGRKS